MKAQYDLTIKKPVAFWNRELSISPKNFFFSLSKVAISGGVGDGKGVAENLVDAAKELGLQEQPGNAAWLLIYKSLQQSLSELINEYKQFFTTAIDEQTHKHLAEELENSLNEIEIGFDASFFDKPHELTFLKEIKPCLIQWLTSFGMSEAEASSFHLRLKKRFTLSLHQQWLESPKNYASIEEALNSPFFKATKNQRSWMQYNAWLQEQSNERMFAEAFSLSQVFVPLRAYYEKRITDNGHRKDRRLGTSKVDRIVIDLHTEMERWVRDFDRDHAVRVISGGPGSGKSSFGKMFAAFVAREIDEVPVIFIPLHHFDPSSNLISAVEQFVREERFLIGSPLEATEGQERLLIIFDGLDELSMQGKAAAETARFFIEEVITTIDKFNVQGCKRQVVVTGRDLSIQSASSWLRGQQQILYILPYFVQDTTSYIDDENLLNEDQRNLWWNRYGKSKGLPYDNGLPDELNIDQLIPITREPLLNYLVALSYERKNITFANETTLNTIYEDLLHAVHERQWDHGCHKGARHLEIEQFIRVLEEIALAVWHGDGRKATINQIFKRCELSNLTRYLEAFQEGAKKGVSRLLTAFYFRQCDQHHVGEKTFEFTHKSFGEYLVAKRIVRLIIQIHRELMRHDDDPDMGFDEREALKRWAELCGPKTMDKYIFHFFCDEVATYSDRLEEWQQTFARLIGFAVRNGLPMEQTDVNRFKEMMRQSRNAEELLMIVHYACAVKTKKVFTINWGDNNANFGDWIRRLQGQQTNPENRLIGKCLILLDLHGCLLYSSDFHDANLQEANLKNVDFENANLVGIILKNTMLQNADLQKSNLKDANLEEADLGDSCLVDTCLRGANLSRADLRGADLRGADLRGANLLNANLRGVELTRADLTDANLSGANLRGAILEEASLMNAKLKGTDLRESFLYKTNLKGVNIDGADFLYANVDIVGCEVVEKSGHKVKSV